MSLFPLGLISQGGGAGGGAVAFELISTTTISAGGTYTVTFNSIPSTWKHLQLRLVTRGNQVVASDQMIIKMNGVAAGSYAKHRMYTTGTGGVFSAGGSGDQITPYTSSQGDTAYIFGVLVADILDYASTNKYKTFRSLSGKASNGNNWLEMTSGLLLSTSALTTLSVEMYSGYYFESGSRFSLYGVRGE